MPHRRKSCLKDGVLLYLFKAASVFWASSLIMSELVLGRIWCLESQCNKDRAKKSYIIRYPIAVVDKRGNLPRGGYEVSPRQQK